MTVRSGGKVCWGSGGAIPPIPSEYELDFFVPAALFVPCQTPLIPAPRENIYLSNGFSAETIKYSAGAVSEASAFYLKRFGSIKPILNPGVACEAQFFTDNASTNQISVSLGTRGATAPGQSVNGAPTYQTLTPTPDGTPENLIRASFMVQPFMWECINFHFRRNVDTHPGTIFFIGLLCYCTQEL